MVEFFELLGNRSFLRVLAFFLENSSSKIHAAALQKKLGISKNSLLESLSKLSEAGLLKREEFGRAAFYSLNNSDALVRELKRLLAVCWLRELVRKAKLEGVEIYLYGSVARGEADEKSDFDLLAIISSPEKKRVVSAAFKHEKVSIVFFTPLEYSALARKDKAFYEAMEKDKVKLI